MKTTSMALALCALLVAGACSNDQRDTAANTPAATPAAASQQADLTPEQLGTLGAEIRKNPNDAQRLLTQRGLDDLALGRVHHDLAGGTDAVAEGRRVDRRTGGDHRRERQGHGLDQTGGGAHLDHGAGHQPRF